MAEKADKDVTASATSAVEKGLVVDETSARLSDMGYKQEMKRNLGMVSVLGLSFAIMAVPYGSSTTLNIALTCGGPVTIIWGVSLPSCRLINGDTDNYSGYLCPVSHYVSLPVLPRCRSTPYSVRGSC